ncbi:sorting nexin-24-like isoform X1 [Tachypleus tridentatus]|uniref:sorting nexin-24-like isoform X1 n=1 Tax=Tachypleus tridentatus TaxID=6853 RepID=UPI003FD155E4
MIRAFIPSFRQAEGEHGGHFTVYRIEVYVSGRCQKIERRYRAFHALHKQLKRLVQTPSFPPKKMRNSSPKFIEQRRQALEHYVQEVLRLQPLPKEVSVFLSLPTISPSASLDSLEQLSIGRKTTHQPILTFLPNPFSEPAYSGSLPDIVVDGVIMGMYSAEEQVTSSVR